MKMRKEQRILSWAIPVLMGFGVLSVARAQVEPVINEFMASNSGSLTLADGSEPDWIEIWNPSGSGVNLAGWYLTDNANNLTKWTFPEGVEVAANSYLLVYATGLDHVVAEGGYHTNFSLSAGGEYLALVGPDGVVRQEFEPTFPPQQSDISYGFDQNGTILGYFEDPTPGAVNGTTFFGFVDDPTFDHQRGFYEESFQLQVTTSLPGATLVYTTDGKTPGSGSPRVHAPDPQTPPVLNLPISSTTIVRVIAEKDGYQSSEIVTQTYLFLDEVISNPAMATSVTQHPQWGPQMRDALLEIPSISLVTQEPVPTEPITSPPEIPVSIEMFFPDGREGFHANAGVERFGGQFSLYAKNAMRISFKKIYGPKRLNYDLFSDTPYGGDTAVDSFDQILLRNGSQDSLFGPQYPHSRGTYIRNRYFYDRQIELGHLSARGKFVHVYLNGVYNGQFHLMERPTADFMASYQGGEEEDYDIMKGRSGIFVSQGNQDAWNQLNANKTNYAVVQDMVDIDNYIDYMLFNFYGGNEHDWYPQHNWIAGRKREAGAKFQFFMWDNDFSIRRGGSTTTGSTANTIDNGGPGNFLSSFLSNPEFKMRMADRAQKHFFNGGMLTKERVQADISELAQRISRTIIPETARWGTRSEVLYTPASFQTYVNWMVNVNGESRTNVVIDQMKLAGIFPKLAAPVYSQQGGEVDRGYPLRISSDDVDVYYTTDGSDPRLTGGGINPSAILVPGKLVDYEALPAGSSWKYHDTGVDLGTAWREKEFNDTTWSSGSAPMGFGQIDNTTLSTLVNSGRHLTFYVRKDFEISGVSGVQSAALEVQADDGVVVYLNGVEVLRHNLPAGEILFSTRATSSGTDEGIFKTFEIDHTHLVEGTNTIAIEVHNSAPGNNDMVIDVALVGQRLNEGNLPIPIDQSTTVRARSIDGSTWSALNEATFLVDRPAGPDSLVVSEFHYHPSDAQGGLAEFLELTNVSDRTIRLGGVAFTEGITFAFNESDLLGPGERIVLVADPDAFAQTFGAGQPVFGTYSGRLSNSGERITIRDAEGEILLTYQYDDTAPWPTEADGGGYSLVLVSPESLPDHEQAGNWRTSVNFGGTPGSSDTLPFEGDPDTDLLGYALANSGASNLMIVEGIPTFEFLRNVGADEAQVWLEVSSDLENWFRDEVSLLNQMRMSGNRNLQRWQLPNSSSGRQFVRIVVSMED